jgi:glycosyltransferase Alg8
VNGQIKDRRNAVHSGNAVNQKTADKLLTGDILNCRKGASWQRQSVMLVVFIAIVVALLWFVGGPQKWAMHRVEVLLTVGAIAFWRWSWFVYQNCRAIIYRFFVFPRIRRQAERAVSELGPIREVAVLATTYHEKPWITASVFHSVFSELSTLKGLTRRPLVVVVTGCDADDDNIREVFADACESLSPVETSQWPPELVLARGDKGKRLALGTGMEIIAESGISEDGVVVILDGDTKLGAGLMNKVLPIFRLAPQVSAVTTNEDGLVKGPAWFAEWTSLRFGLRHRSMCSISLSGKLLCLTGRFSVFRAGVVLDPTFRQQVEKDTIHHWLWGSFEMLSGDDKSTWFWLAKNRHRMLYVPDAMVTTYEVISQQPLHRAMANIRRWSGNSVRHGWRAIMLGPKVTGWFVWLCLIDQRLTILTVLFGPSVALFSLFTERYEMAAAYALWVLLSRLSHAAIAWRQGRRFSIYYVPLQILSDWSTALTKLWVVFHPAKQNWLNRGGRKLNTTQGSAFYGLRTAFAHYLYVFSCVCVGAFVGLFIGFLPILRDTRLFWTPVNSKPSKGLRHPETQRTPKHLTPHALAKKTFGPLSTP